MGISRKAQPAHEVVDQFRERRQCPFIEVLEKSMWFARLRWWVSPCLFAGMITARFLGFDFEEKAVIAIALFILLYNVLVYLSVKRLKRAGKKGTGLVKPFIYLQVGLDFFVMLLLFYFTGGASSPFIFFFLFQIIFAATLLSRREANIFSFSACIGIILVVVSELEGWVPNCPVYYDQRPLNILNHPQYAVVLLFFFAVAAVTISFFTTSFMRLLKKRITDLVAISAEYEKTNNKYQALFSMISVIGSSKNLDNVLSIVTKELAEGMEVKAISVKLLDRDEKFLKYAAAYGLPDAFFRDKVVEVAKSPLNRRIIEGEPFATGNITEREMFQFSEVMADAAIKSVLFMPLTVDQRIIGILGAYCSRQDRFSDDDTEFFSLASGLVAIALENARSYEAIKKFTGERSRFMDRVAHNLRAPLNAVISMAEVVEGKHLGDISEEQQEYLRRIQRRTRAMLSMVNDLMTLSKSRTEQFAYKKENIDVRVLGGRLERTFVFNAMEKKIDFCMEVPAEIADLWGNEALIEQLFENLISNAIKYTPRGGSVTVAFSNDNGNTLCAEIRDTGIGIPEENIPDLFTEFFRAPNARELEESGTGLGLAIVKEIVELHNGKITVQSERGRGTIVTVRLPITPGKK